MGAVTRHPSVPPRGAAAGGLWPPTFGHPVPAPVKHAVSLLDWDAEQIASLFELAHWMSQQRRKVTAQLAPDMLLGCCFYQNSTRTRLSFEAAAHLVGGASIGFADIATTRAGDFFNESLEDTIRVVASYCDAVVLRHVRDDAAAIAADIAGVPVISAGAGEHEHPTQGLLDTWTLVQALGSLQGARLGLVGDPACRAIRSILIAACRLGISRAVFLTVPGTSIPRDETELMVRHGVTWDRAENATDLLRQVDAVSMIPFDLPDFHLATAPQAARRTNDPRFIFNRAQLSRHPVPIVHTGPRGIELPDDALELPNVHYFDGIRSGVALRAALLCRLLGRA